MNRGVSAGVAALGLAGVMLWWWQAESPETVVPAGTARAVSPPVAAGATSAAPGGLWAQLAEATRQADAGAGQGQRFCGAPFMDDKAEPTAEMNQRLTRHIDAAVSAASKRLAQAPDELGRLASAVLARDEARIAEVAAQTRDPVVYGIAMQGCDKLQADAAFGAAMKARRNGASDDTQVLPPPSACAAVTAEQWVQVDPGNATAWWVLASFAGSREGAARAVRTGNAAPRVVSLRGQLFKRIAADGGLDPVALTPLLVQAQKIDMSFQVRESLGVADACGRAGEGDAARQEECRSLLIDVIRRQPSVALQATYADWAGEHYGVAPERLPRQRAELRALEEDMGNWLRMDSPTSDAMSCERSRRVQAFEIAAVTEGEEQAYRRLKGAAQAASADRGEPR